MTTTFPKAPETINAKKVAMLENDMKSSWASAGDPQPHPPTHRPLPLIVRQLRLRPLTHPTWVFPKYTADLTFVS